jgi:2-iminobutanoate/2-iminopropanoate deaminase
MSDRVKRRTIITDRLARPSGVFAHGVSVEPGRLIYVSGMLGRDAAGRLVGRGDVRAQTDQCLRNIQAVLETEGATLADVVKVTVFIRNMDDFKAIHEVRARYFPADRLPASTMVEISRFTDPEALIEIEAVAAVPHSQAGAGG